MTRSGGATRGVSPVVGTVLLIGILVALVSVSSYVIFGLADTNDPVPNVVFKLQETDGQSEYALVHENGDDLDGDDVELRGAADPDSPSGITFSIGDNLSFYPIADQVKVIWYGDSDTSYVLTTVDIEAPLPDPDEGCDWVDDETNGGTDPITIDGIVVDCDVQTDDQIKVQNDAVIVGETVSDAKGFDGDSATVYGDADVENVLNLQDGTITGDATSRTADVKVGNGTVEGSVDAEKVAEVTDGTVIEKDMESQTKDTKVLESEVEGSVTADGIVKLDNATIHGHVYIDPTDFDCTDSTVNGKDCGSYTPKDPSTW